MANPTALPNLDSGIAQGVRKFRDLHQTVRDLIVADNDHEHQYGGLSKWKEIRTYKDLSEAIERHREHANKLRQEIDRYTKQVTMNIGTIEKITGDQEILEKIQSQLRNFDLEGPVPDSPKIAMLQDKLRKIVNQLGIQSSQQPRLAHPPAAWAAQIKDLIHPPVDPAGYSFEELLSGLWTAASARAAVEQKDRDLAARASAIKEKDRALADLKQMCTELEQDVEKEQANMKQTREVKKEELRDVLSIKGKEEAEANRLKQECSRLRTTQKELEEKCKRLTTDSEAAPGRRAIEKEQWREDELKPVQDEKDRMQEELDWLRESYEDVKGRLDEADETREEEQLALRENLTNTSAELEATNGTLSKISAEHDHLKTFAEKSWVELFENQQRLSIKQLFATGLVKEDDVKDFEPPGTLNGNPVGCTFVWDLADILTPKENLDMLGTRPILTSWLYYIATGAFSHGQHAAILAVVQKRFLAIDSMNPWYLPFINRYIHRAVIALAGGKAPESLAIAISLATQCFKRTGLTAAALVDIQTALPLSGIVEEPLFVATALIRFYKALQDSEEQLLLDPAQVTYAGLNINAEVLPSVNDQFSIPELAFALFSPKVLNSDY